MSHYVGARLMPITKWSELFLLGHVCFPENSFREIIFQTFLCLFAIRKSDQRKTLSGQRKIWLGFQESIVIKPGLEINPVKGPGPGFYGSTRVNP